MDPSEARRRLLEQHAYLRSLVARSVEIAEAFRRGDPVTDELGERLEAVRLAFAEHNALEAAMLEPLLSSGDAWAPARVARMREEHAAEHEVFAMFFAGPITEMATGLPELAEDLEAHMAAEERTFLHRAVLRDSLVTDGGAEA